MAIEKLSATPSLAIPAAAGAAQASLTVQPSPFQALAPELQAHVFTCLPIGEFFRCMLVSTQWQRLVIALPGKGHDKFKLLVQILKEANALLPQVKAEMTQGIQLTFTRVFLSLAFRLDREWVGAAQLVGIDELIWVFAGGDSAKRDAVLRREVESATSSEDLHQLLGLLEVAREEMDPTDVKELLRRAKEVTLDLVYDVTEEDFLRTVALSLELDSNQVDFTETNEFLAKEKSHSLKQLGCVPLKMRLIQVELGQKLQEFTNKERSINWPFEHYLIARKGGNLKERALALVGLFLRAVDADLPTAKAKVEESADQMFQCFGWLAIAKREWELGLPSASETLNKAMLLLSQDLQVRELQLEALLDIAQLIANRC